VKGFVVLLLRNLLFLVGDISVVSTYMKVRSNAIGRMQQIAPPSDDILAQRRDDIVMAPLLL
jgi:hypothetical protein